ncbi:acyl-protein synthetase [Alteromonas sp. C1M14]|uniref:LuxE/PaaK family acyltransferase n=1 Tax=Alteromonas sp. C1M14 TaxID=2841567 RepID=UPI001C0943DD|nr:acyl-protein synthetase [Alteromonas sp. C1M14]MBU2977949.1 acyl-protein synthetase [Alteromonas sp. C1M14]
MSGQAIADDYQSCLNELLAQPVYGMTQREKSNKLRAIMAYLHQHHLTGCAAYGALFADYPNHFTCYEQLPYLAVRLFKLQRLASIPEADVFRELRSSGTTGQTPARVILDKATSARQSKALVTIMQQFIGKQRLPMLIIDSPEILKSPDLSARGAGIQGMAFFGRDHTYALNADMSLNTQAVAAFVAKHKGKPVLLFGFTFMVWLHFVKAIERSGIHVDLSQGILIHSGGWKKLVDQQVTNETFKRTIRSLTGLTRIHNFYGMAEQVGSVFVECEHGHLHAPSLADVMVRCPYTLEPLPHGKTGLLHVISALPTSYPGYSILTEDMGSIIGEDDCPCGRKGRYFSIAGRLPKTEIRGCSDTAGTL